MDRTVYFDISDRNDMALCTGFEPVSPIKSAAFREQCVTSYTNTALAPTFGLEPKHQKLSDYSHLSKMIPYHLGLCRHFNHYF